MFRAEMRTVRKGGRPYKGSSDVLDGVGVSELEVEFHRFAV
jgi:hypothetical protein